ncbi:MAG: hypothetical protein LBO78_02595 [Rickettsiales bacterium]|nr:hypothetical protein [Rickettsiales bacterium]
MSSVLYVYNIVPHDREKVLQMDKPPEDKKIEIVDDERMRQLEADAGNLYIMKDEQTGEMRIFTMIEATKHTPRKYKDYLNAYANGRGGR